MTKVRREASFYLLNRLYQEELRRQPSRYLEQHAHRNSILRQVSVFDRYLPYLPRTGAFLDWGCHHAPDACLLRSALGSGIELHGCDFIPSDRFPAFHGYADLDYRQLDGPIGLPYPEARFDAVIASGVLEHTMNDSEVLKELHRVLKEDGLLVVTFLPNRLSYTEFASRRLRSAAHARLYGLSEARRLMLHHGFRPVALAYHQMVPGQQYQGLFGWLWPANSALERAWPLNKLSSNLMVICRRRTLM
ncbi:MAG TPA: class I SAM-dependent methyltransferase [Acidimicrobiales bacterium]|nr:class I SAM-dependent methyltransferase [Acidimicrobiales bacterium]